MDDEDDFDISSAWMDEIRRRCRDIDRGEVDLISGEEALAVLLKKFCDV